MFGALHALESWSQLFEKGAGTGAGPEAYGLQMRGLPWKIADSPRFAHRGVLLDTSRHCPTAAEYAAKARLNLLVTGMHGVGSYLMDQRGLFHADPNDTNATNVVWSAIAQARGELIELQGRPAPRAAPAAAAPAAAAAVEGGPGPGPVGAGPAAVPGPGAGAAGESTGGVLVLTPQIALFTDSASALFWRLSTGEHHSAEGVHKEACPPGHWPCSDPLSWNQNVLIDPVLALGTIGAPLRQYQLTDLLLDECPPAGRQQQNGCLPVEGLRLAIFTNAHVLPAAVRSAIATKLARKNVTLAFSYAVGVLDAEGGTVPDGIGAATGLGGSVVRGDGSLQLNVSLEPGIGGLSGWYGIGDQRPTPDPVDPWFYLDDNATGNVGKSSSCSSMARYTANDKIAIGRCQLAGHAVVYSGLPALPTPLWREVARQAGVHTFVDGDAVVEVAGTSLFVRCTGAHWVPHTEAHVVDGAASAAPGTGCSIRLPSLAAAVTTSAGLPVCKNCDHWSVPTGSAELYHVEALA